MIEAIVLAGGLGTRLREVVSDVPKPMAPIGNRPFLAYLLENLAKNGVTRVILSVGYMSEKIFEYFGDSYYGMSIAYSVEKELLGTGGAIKLALDLIKGDYAFIFNGDTYLNINLQLIDKLYNQHKELIIIGVDVYNVGRYGKLTLDENNIYLTGFEENKENKSGLINAGCYVLDKKIFHGMATADKFSFERDFILKNLDKKKFKCIKVDGFFLDIGIPGDLEKLKEYFK